MELKKGGEEPLEALADLLDTDEALRPVSGSKLDRAVLAMRAALPTMPESVRGRWQTAPPRTPQRQTEGGPTQGPTRHRIRRRTAETDPATPPGGDAEPAASEQDGSDSASSEDRPEHVLRPTAHARRPGPRTLGIVADDSLPEAARKVLRFHFARMQNREAGARDGDDAEDLHDMRVAVRRMRAAWRVFDDAFKSSRTKRLRRRLESLSDKLGTVRDLDVLTQGLEAYRLGLDPEQQPGLDPLLSLWARQRSSARKQLIEELDSGGYSAFVHEMEEFLAAGSNAAASVPTPTIPHRVRDTAPSQIWGAYETVRAYELVLPWADIETIHELRIATKWLRYTLEFFGETLGPDGPRLLGRVTALQDFLGYLHDADVAAKLARDVLVARAGELSRVETEAIGAYLHSRERELARRRRSLGPVWRARQRSPFQASPGPSRGGPVALRPGMGTPSTCDHRGVTAHASIQLHLLRHAHAGDPIKASGPDDARPLSEKGRGQAERLGLFLAESGFEPDAILSSPKIRALDTARLVATPLGLPTLVVDALAGPLDLGMVEELLAIAGNPVRPLLVGHDPDFSVLAAELVGMADLPIRKGTLVRIDVERPIRPGAGVLRWLIPPDLLALRDPAD